MKRLLVQTSLIQSLSVALMLATTLYATRVGGASAQGSLALVKSFNDLLVAIFALGLPSAIVITINRSGRAHSSIVRAIAIYSVILLPALPFVTCAAFVLFVDGNQQNILGKSFLIGAGAAFFVSFALLRGVLLTFMDGPLFSFISILHWIFIFIATVLLINRTEMTFEIAYFVAGLCSLVLLWLNLRRPLLALPADIGHAPIDWKVLRAQSFHVAIQAVLYGLQPYLSTVLLARNDPGLVSAGLFNVAALMITLPNLLVALVAPVLLNRWSKDLDWMGLRNVRRHALVVAVIAQAIGLSAWPLVPLGLQTVFGDDFVQGTTAVRILLFAPFAVIAGRVLSPALQGLGRNRDVTTSCLWRLVALCATVAAMALAGYPLLTALSVGWVVGEYAALITLLVARAADPSSARHAERA